MVTAKFRWSVAAVLPVGGWLVAVGVSALTTSVQAGERGPAYVPGEVVVQFKRGTWEARRHGAAGRARCRVREALNTEAMRGAGAPEVAVVETLGNVAETVQALTSDPAVASAEPNWIYTHQATSNDPAYTGNYLWNMYGDATNPKNVYGCQAGEAWAAGHTGSRTVCVGVIDEGVDFRHPDLQANVWTNPYDPVDGIDNDRNGYVDDVHGWDFAANNSTVYDGSATNSSTDAHGTHVAGTIGAVGGNGKGVAGVNWAVTIIPAKFLTSSGGSLSNAIKAIDYITDLKLRHGMNIVATSNSWGGSGYSSSLLAAITRAANAGILFVAAAGNGGYDGVGDNNDTNPGYPASYDTTSGAHYDAVIAVAAIQKDGTLARYSNYGVKNVDLGAPGSGIWSTTPNGAYSAYSGTSMATPHVTGAVALYASTHPGATAATLRTAVLNAARATATGSLAGKTVTGGRLNVGGF